MPKVYPVNLIDYLSIPYEDGGRSPSGLDCWGQVRAVRHYVFGKPLLPEWAGVDRHSKGDYARAENKTTADQLKEIEKPKAGAIIGVYKRSICTHVAIVVNNGGKLSVLDTGHKTGARIHTQQEFKVLFWGCEIKYYD